MSGLHWRLGERSDIFCPCEKEEDLSKSCPHRLRMCCCRYWPLAPLWEENRYSSREFHSQESPISFFFFFWGGVYQVNKGMDGEFGNTFISQKINAWATPKESPQLCLVLVPHFILSSSLQCLIPCDFLLSVFHANIILHTLHKSKLENNSGRYEITLAGDSHEATLVF
jgi:hypothetical protein